MRVSPPRVFPEAARAPRPPAELAGAADAHRQTGFVLGEEVAHALAGLRLESAVAEASVRARHRTAPVAALLATGSRGWLARLQALHALEWGNYAAAVALAASAAELEAACAALIADGGAAWRGWLDGAGLRDLPEERAAGIVLGAPPEAANLPARLAETRVAAGVLSGGAPGASVLIAGGESGADRLAVTFGDRDFHLGLAELTNGWLLALGAAKAELLLSDDCPLPLPDADGLRGWAREAERLLSEPRRCRMECADGGPERYIIENWRRAPTGAGRRLVLRR